MIYKENIFFSKMFIVTEYAALKLEWETSALGDKIHPDDHPDTVKSGKVTYAVSYENGLL